jgi:hypothetical protein
VVVVLDEMLATVVGWLDVMMEVVAGMLLSRASGFCWYLRSKENNTMN